MTTAATAPMAAIRTNRRRRATPRIGRQPTSHASRIRQGSGADADGLPFGDVRVAVPGPIASAHDEEPPGVRRERRRLKRCRARTRRVRRAPVALAAGRRRLVDVVHDGARRRRVVTCRLPPEEVPARPVMADRPRSAERRLRNPGEARRCPVAYDDAGCRGTAVVPLARLAHAVGRVGTDPQSVRAVRDGPRDAKRLSSHARWRLARAVALDGPRSSSIPRSRRSLKPAPLRHRRSARCQLRAPKFCTRRR